MTLAGSRGKAWRSMGGNGDGIFIRIVSIISKTVDDSERYLEGHRLLVPDSTP